LKCSSLCIVLSARTTSNTYGRALPDSSINSQPVTEVFVGNVCEKPLHFQREQEEGKPSLAVPCHLVLQPK
jgi:hypothetical protein